MHKNVQLCWLLDVRRQKVWKKYHWEWTGSGWKVKDDTWESDSLLELEIHSSGMSLFLTSDVQMLWSTGWGHPEHPETLYILIPTTFHLHSKKHSLGKHCYVISPSTTHLQHKEHRMIDFPKTNKVKPRTKKHEQSP